MVIVLDPGHGGEEDGGTFGKYIEKNMNLQVAYAMKDRLEKYDGVTVVLTRYDDSTLSLKDRQNIAKANNADYFFALHFNLSVGHDIYGSEVWIPSTNSLYKKMYPVASEVMKSFDSMGLFNRGIKTKIGNHGDYYGVIRIGTEYGIPSAIIEHCHMDNQRDTEFIPANQNEALKAACVTFGMKDADAVARALNLSSTILGIDNSQYVPEKSNVKASIIRPDESEPNVNEISVLATDSANSTVTLHMKAQDKDSFILYYRYSLDGGVTFSPLYDWPRTAWNKSVPEYDIQIKVPQNRQLDIITLAYNSFDKFTVSNNVNCAVMPVAYANEPEAAVPVVEEKQIFETVTYDIKPENGNKTFENGPLIMSFLTGALILLFVLLIFGKKFRKMIRRK